MHGFEFDTPDLKGDMFRIFMFMKEACGPHVFEPTFLECDVINCRPGYKYNDLLPLSAYSTEIETFIFFSRSFLFTFALR